MLDHATESTSTIDRVSRMLSVYEAAGMQDSREVSFLRGCESMLKSRGFVTANMSNWMMQILESGGPRIASSQDTELADLLETSAPHAGVQEQFMVDMISRLRTGKELTERQRKAVLALHDQVQRTKAKGILTADETRAMEFAPLIARGYSHGYMESRPGSFNKVNKICEKFLSDGRINRSDWVTISSIMTRLQDIAYPKYKSGDILFYKPTGDIAFIVETPSVDEWGSVGYKVLVNGTLIRAKIEMLGKRTPRNAQR